MEYTKARAQHVVAILKDRKSEVEAGCQRGRGIGGVRAYSHNLAARGLDCIQLSLQLHELLSTGASSAFFIEVDDHFVAMKVGERRRVPAAGGKRVSRHRRSDREPTIRDHSVAGAATADLYEGDHRCSDDDHRACNRIRPPVALR